MAGHDQATRDGHRYRRKPQPPGPRPNDDSHQESESQRVDRPTMTEGRAVGNAQEERDDVDVRQSGEDHQQRCPRPGREAVGDPLQPGGGKSDRDMADAREPAHAAD